MVSPATEPSSDGNGHGVTPVAIIGAACRFSGKASNQHGFWDLLSAGKTSWTDSAQHRFNLSSFWHPHSQLTGSFNCRGVHVLEQDPALFDNDFFGISGIEAKAIDPQQRLLLEVAYETFENAGIKLSQLEGSDTGVYCAVSYQDYDGIQSRDPETSAAYRFTGTGPCMVANRISYVFDMRGPSMTMDTGCSSTLVAVHEACKTLHAGEAEQVLVGGTNLMLDPDKLMATSSMQFLSPDGRCFSFDSRANGYGRGEGLGAILLKPLDAAVRDGDPIRGVIRGTAIGADGRTPGITMPSSSAQRRTIYRAYQAAGLDPRDTLYIEAHGTGTTAGDGCEAAAFAQTFCADRSETMPLVVGSVKANIGHTECVSGLAAIIKSILMLEKGLIVSNPTFSSPNPKFALQNVGIKVPTGITKWPEGVPKRVSINNSGYGGMNAHIILDGGPDFPLQNDNSQLIQCSGPKLFVWTHQREQYAGRTASIWKQFLAARQSESTALSLDDLTFTLGSRRSLFPYRTTVVASDIHELVRGLQELEGGTKKPLKAASKLLLCYVFTGQGAQWAQMGCELLAVYPVFEESLRRAEGILIKLGASWNLLDELRKPDGISNINDPVLAQPCSTAIQIAFVDLLESCGVKPDRICGHSSGEIAAAYAFGALSASDALKVAYGRGVAVGCLRERFPGLQGGMLVVGLPETQVPGYLTTHPDITIACINSPTSVTLSGDRQTLEGLSKEFDAADVFNRKLLVNVAYHSQDMKNVATFYRDTIRDIQPRTAKPGIQMVSSVSGEFLRGDELGPEYWVENLVSPVRFSDALSTCLQLGRENTTASPRLVVEIGPHSALRSPILETLKNALALHSTSYLFCLYRRRDAVDAWMALMGELFSRGVSLDLNRVNRLHDRSGIKVLTDLPSYKWHHEVAYWHESRRSKAYRFRRFPRHDLLGSIAPDSISAEPTWRNYLRLAETPWIRGHSVDGNILFGSPGFVTMIVEALKQQLIAENLPWEKNWVTLEDMMFERPLIVPRDAAGVEVFMQLRPVARSSRDLNSTWKEFRIFSLSLGNESTEHCRGLVSMSGSIPQSVSSSQDAAPGTETQSTSSGNDVTWTDLPPAKLYKELANQGIEYSEPYLCLESISACPWRSDCQVVVPDISSAMPSRYQEPHCIHPVVIDACIHALFPGIQAAGSLCETPLATSIGQIHVFMGAALRPGDKVRSRTRTSRSGPGQITAEVSATKMGSEDSGPFLQVNGIRFMLLGEDRRLQASGGRSRGPLCYSIRWQLDPFWSTSEALAKHCREGLADGHPNMRKRYDAFSYAAIRDVLNHLSATDENAVTGYRRFYLQWIRSQVIDHMDASAITSELEADMKVAGPWGEALVRLCHRLREVLLGTVDAISVLMSGNLLYRLYNEDEPSKRCIAMLARYVRLVRSKVPYLRILEIGGGTGSLTFVLLDAIFEDSADGAQGATEYMFTDVSTVFIAHVRERTTRYKDFVKFGRFDIEQSPIDQGFEPNSFDLVVASNAVHVSKSIGSTLAHIKTLLKPGGHLAFVETTAPSTKCGFIFGALPGWWVGMDDGRTNSPLLGVSAWDDALTQHGFSGASIVMQDYDSEEDHEYSLIISAAVAREQQNPSSIEMSIITRKEDDDVARDVSALIKVQMPEVVPSAISLSTNRSIRGMALVLLDIGAKGILFEPCHDTWTRIRGMLSTADTIIWVSAGGAIECDSPQNALVTGLGRAVRSERPEMRMYTVDVDAGTPSSSAQMAAEILQACRSILVPDSLQLATQEWEIAVRNGGLLVPRVVPESVPDRWVEDSVSTYNPRLETNIDPNQPLELRVRSPNMLDKLYWADHGALLSPRLGQITVRLQYASLNSRDVMTAMGQLDSSWTLLVEGSGTVVAVGDESKSQFSVGDSVCFFAPDGLATITNIDQQHAFLIPRDMSMEDAAAIPVAYATAMLSLRDVAHIHRGESVLIHAAAGAVGQAAIAVARFLGAAEIFVTVGTPEKREMMRDKFGIPDDHILSSRDGTFAEAVLRATHRRGVDVVLNSLSGEAHGLSCGLLAPFGRFVDISRKEITENGKLALRPLGKNRSFSTVDLTFVAKDKPALFYELVRTSLDLIRSGELKMLEPVVVVHASEASEKLRIMQSGNHHGKVVLKVDFSLPLMFALTRARLRFSLGLQPPVLNCDVSYLVTGGTGGLGKAFVRHLAQLGAQHIITLSRAGPSGKGMAELSSEMRNLGVNLTVVKGDVCSMHSIEDVKAARGGRPVKGVIHSVMALQDSFVKDMTLAQWREGIAPKVKGTLNLHAELGEGLDFFILLGSAGSITAGYGQGNYAASNTFVDAFARNLSCQGLPARAIDLGQTRDAGYVAENLAAASFATARGISSHSLEELLAAINFAIQHPVSPHPDEAQIICGVAPDAGVAAGTGAGDAARQRADAKFSHVWSRVDPSGAEATSVSADRFDARAALRGAATTGGAVEAAYTGLVHKLAELLDTATDEIQPDRSVATYGVDSLVELELRNWILQHLGARVTMIEIMSTMAVMQLAEVVAQRSDLVGLAVFGNDKKNQ